MISTFPPSQSPRLQDPVPDVVAAHDVLSDHVFRLVMPGKLAQVA